MSARQVMRQRRRYLGVLISIALGTAGLIVILTMGRIVKKNLNNDLTLIGGATIINVNFDESRGAKNRTAPLRLFSESSAEAVRAAPGVALVSLTITKEHHARALLDKNVYEFPLMGVDRFFWEATGHRMAAGESISPKHVQERQQVCVIGEKLAHKVFKDASPLGYHLRIDNSLYLVVGVMDKATSGELANYAFVPITTLEDRFEHLPRTNLMLVRCATWDDVERVAQLIPKLIEQWQPIEFLRVQVPVGALQQVKRITFWVEMFIYLAIGATLFLGGYGIWSGMMAAVKARTREIGLKKAMGAEDADIMLQFMTEAVCLSGIAALFGIVFGRVGVEFAGRLLGNQPPEMVIVKYAALSLVFSLLLGAIAGYYPSLRASRMEVVRAIRYE
jgi:putative ABC transport system permease protein